jgi:hypothetical protein
MAGYLEEYGVQDYRRSRIVKYIILSVIALAILAVGGYWFFRDYSEKQVAKRFLADVNAHNYQAAYSTWCPTPCRNYDFARFAADWAAGKKTASPWKIDSTDSCKAFLTVNVTSNGSELQSLSVERGTSTLSFAPSPECQEYKWHWKEFFRRIFGGSSSSKAGARRNAPPKEFAACHAAPPVKSFGS